MSPKKKACQEEYLYTAVWHVGIDKMFISIIKRESTRGNFRVGATNFSALLTAQQELNTKFNMFFTLDECRSKLYLLQKRYSVFDWVVHYSGIGYIPSTNEMHVEPYIMDRLCKECPFAYAYEKYGDPDWPDLCSIFGRDELPDDDDEEVPPFAEEIPHSEESVTRSPIFSPPRNIGSRRERSPIQGTSLGQSSGDDDFISPSSSASNSPAYY